jgi:outer membrane protein assembly factor BamB
MWRADAQRSGQWEGELAEQLHLQWVRAYPPLQPAYQNPRLHFDAGYEPVAAHDTLLVASSRNDRLTALDAATGQEKWRFYAEGPIRFAPALWNDRVYFGSDDGCLYCLEIESGELLWKFRAVPSARKLLGNGRLISTWPVRGGPVVADDTVYFAAGVWSFEGVFVYALDAESGDVVWINDRTGFIYGQHPHDAEAFGGLTPQGYLVVNDDELVVPCGTALPARFDRATGELKHFALPSAGRRPGGWFTSAASRAKRRGQAPPEEEISKEERESGLIFDSDTNRDRHEGGWYQGPGSATARSRVTLGDREIDFTEGYPGVEGTVYSVLAADGRLLVVTREGEIYCFGSQATEPVRYPLEEPRPSPEPEPGAAAAAELLATAGGRSGYAVWIGAGADDGEAVEALVRQSQLQVVVVEPDGEKCARLRRRLDAADLLGTRVAVHEESADRFELPPYMASLIVCKDVEAAGGFAEKAAGENLLERLFQSLRPFGGTAYVGLAGVGRAAIEEAVEKAALEGGTWEATGQFGLLRRTAALPGAGNYTGGWSSSDERVAAPLGVLWFGDALAHFKRAPQPMIFDGVMVSYDKDWSGWEQGARPPYPLLPPTYSDIYTGRILSPGELGASIDSLPTRDLDEKTLQQYRPPTQKDDWKPETPVIGQRINPLTGETEPRVIPKSYGCDGGVDYGHLYTLRSGTAAFYDKQLESGTIHISGPRSGCTNSIIPAGGILNVPYFFEGCTCSYPLPVGLALVSVPPEREQWAVWGEGQPESIHRVGINFGAPGARMTDAGTLWLDYPRSGGPAPELQLTTAPETAAHFYRHSLWMEGGRGWPWVAASGIKGANSVTLEGLKPGEYTVRLYFAEPDEQRAPGERRFDVSIGGQRVLESFDIVDEAGGAMRGVIKEFAGISLDGRFDLELAAAAGETLISGIEVIAEGLALDPME